MSYRDWLNLLATMGCGFIAIIVGALLVELARVLTNKANRQRLFARLKTEGILRILSEALYGERQQEQLRRQSAGS